MRVGPAASLFGSELFVVFNEGRDTTARGYPGLQNRTFVVKANRLLRF